MLFELLLRQEYAGRNVLNRWYYNGTGTPASVDLSFALVSAFGGVPDGITGEFPTGSIMADLASLQTSTLKYKELVAEAMYDVADFYSVPYPSSQAGTRAGTPMSPFAAFAVQSNRVRTDIRRGNKRFAGLSESDVQDEGELVPTFAGFVQDLADKMGDNLTYDDEGNTLTFQPVVLSFQKHDPDVDHEDFWYSKYSTNALQLDHAALGIQWTAKQYMTTQNTRKK